MEFDFNGVYGTVLTGVVYIYIYIYIYLLLIVIVMTELGCNMDHILPSASTQSPQPCIQLQDLIRMLALEYRPTINILLCTRLDGRPNHVL